VINRIQSKYKIL